LIGYFFAARVRIIIDLQLQALPSSEGLRCCGYRSVAMRSRSGIEP
jgi:hypothetical protein